MAQACLNGWLGEESAMLATTTCAERYIMIATVDTHRDPRYIHVVEFLRSADALLAWLAVHLDTLECSAGAPAPIDFKFLLDPTDRARVDGMLDEREREQLRRVRPRGCA